MTGMQTCYFPNDGAVRTNSRDSLDGYRTIQMIHKRIGRGARIGKILTMDIDLLRKTKSFSKTEDLMDRIMNKDWPAVRDALKTSEGSNNFLRIVNSFPDAPECKKGKLRSLMFHKQHDCTKNVSSRTFSTSCSGALDFQYTPTLLHLACTVQAPIRLLERINSIRPDFMTQQNDFQQSVLHLAAEWGESPHVLEWLIQIAPESASKADSFGRMPLHSLCASGRLPRQGTNYRSNSQRSQLIGILGRLCYAHPQAIHARDGGGMTPIMHATQNRTKHSLVMVLLTFSQEQKMLSSQN